MVQNDGTFLTARVAFVRVMAARKRSGFTDDGIMRKRVEHAQGFDRTHIIITVLIILIFLSGDHYFFYLVAGITAIDIAHKAYRRSSFRLNSC